MSLMQIKSVNVAEYRQGYVVQGLPGLRTVLEKFVEIRGGDSAALNAMLGANIARPLADLHIVRAPEAKTVINCIAHSMQEAFQQGNPFTADYADAVALGTPFFESSWHVRPFKFAKDLYYLEVRTPNRSSTPQPKMALGMREPLEHCALHVVLAPIHEGEFLLDSAPFTQILNAALGVSRSAEELVGALTNEHNNPGEVAKIDSSADRLTMRAELQFNVNNLVARWKQVQRRKKGRRYREIANCLMEDQWSVSKGLITGPTGEEWGSSGKKRVKQFTVPTISVTLQMVDGLYLATSIENLEQQEAETLRVRDLLVEGFRALIV